MADRCTLASARQHGSPALDEAADLLETTAQRLAELEAEVQRWRGAWAAFKAMVPYERSG
jgi:hypothetical protein